MTTVRKRLALTLAIFFFAVCVSTPASAQSVPWREELQPARAETEIVVGDDPITVELSVTNRQQTLGLGYRNGLPDGKGMLFVNESAQVRSFWMKGMRFCIDIVWIEDGEITGAAESVCPDPDGSEDSDRARYSSEIPVTYVLELPAGWLDEHGYGAGTTVQIPDDLLAEPS